MVTAAGDAGGWEMEGAAAARAAAAMLRVKAARLPYLFAIACRWIRHH